MTVDEMMDEMDALRSWREVHNDREMTIRITYSQLKQLIWWSACAEADFPHDKLSIEALRMLLNSYRAQYEYDNGMGEIKYV